MSDRKPECHGIPWDAAASSYAAVLLIRWLSAAGPGHRTTRAGAREHAEVTKVLVNRGRRLRLRGRVRTALDLSHSAQVRSYLSVGLHAADARFR